MNFLQLRRRRSRNAHLQFVCFLLFPGYFFSWVVFVQHLFSRVSFLLRLMSLSKHRFKIEPDSERCGRIGVAGCLGDACA